MQQFLLNEKVITQLHMQAVNLKQQTKFTKKYDLPNKSSPLITQSKQIYTLLQQQRKILSKPKINQLSHNQQNSPKTKNLLSTLRFNQIPQNSSQDSSTRNFIKQNYFTFRGIKNQPIKQKQIKKILSRTCNLISVMKYGQNYVAPYDVNPDLRFKRNPQCFISPEGIKSNEMKMQFVKLSKEKQNLNMTERVKKETDSKKIFSIKQMVDKQMEELIKKRKKNCRTAPQKHISKVNNQNGQFVTDLGVYEEDICRMEGKIYNEIRENKEKLIRRNKERIGINIEKNKPFGESEINKNTGKILKKYQCESMAYFQKFLPRD